MSAVIILVVVIIVWGWLTGRAPNSASASAIVEAFVSMKADLETEGRAMTKQWAKREKQLEHVVNTTALMYGDIQGTAGQALGVTTRK